MKFKIIHETKYTFNSEVYLEPHQLRLKPKGTSFCNLESFDIEIFPKPIGIKEQFDPENNVINFAWFDKGTTSLDIRSTSVITLSEYNPFSFIIYPSEYLNVPFEYSDDLKSTLYASLEKAYINQLLIDYVNKTLEKSNNTMDFIANLTKQIHQDFQLSYRHEGSPFEPNKTFELKNGSCRDLAWMQIHLLRNFGIAARFVSGYYYIEMEYPSYELHAWVEVYIPGTGWIGFDPSHGMVTGNTHISLASSSDFNQAMTITGSVRGSASSELTNYLYILKF
ncbi:transglutaminase family protein [Algibacter sp. L4_22]|uniref:transglutaminase family protein n=1 Tax=Algibacter sp. L4_22 TaxID=2942477 RepID=UPI00201B4AA6|nr:transglutaminase family protein [Algibacter sp. L4_22]MCL5130306.1 transglutaminase family protein [Algibacter sp. L4_22]